MTDTFATLLEAPMGGGKTTTSTAFMVDGYYKNIYSIVDRNDNEYPVNPYGLGIVRLKKSEFVSSQNIGRLIKVPKGWQTNSSLKLFCNYHLFGVKYMYAPMNKVLDYVNTPVMENAIWTVDESYMDADSRRGMNPMTIFMTNYAQSMRKRHIDLQINIQHGRFLDWRLRYITKRKILTKYNDKTFQVKLLIQDLAKNTEKSVSYDARVYWPFFDTKELPPMPEAIVNRAKRWS